MMVVFTPHSMSIMFSFSFGVVHGHDFLGFYWCVWLVLSWTSLVFTIIVFFNFVGVHGHVLLNSIGVHGRALLNFIVVHGCALLGFVGVPSHYSNLILLVFLVIAF